MRSEAANVLKEHPDEAELNRLAFVFFVGHLEELFRCYAHGQITGLEPFPETGRAVRVDLDKRRQLRFGPDDLLALASYPALYPDHALLLTRNLIDTRDRALLPGIISGAA